eukprot:5237114-Prymnesium_polylepis.2
MAPSPTGERVWGRPTLPIELSTVASLGHVGRESGCGVRLSPRHSVWARGGGALSLPLSLSLFPSFESCAWCGGVPALAVTLAGRAASGTGAADCQTRRRGRTRRGRGYWSGCRGPSSSCAPPRRPSATRP